MRMRVTTLALLAACVMPDLAAAAAQLTAKEAQALELVRAMRDDELYLLTFRVAVKDDPIGSACLAGIRRQTIAPIIARALASSLDAKELEDATRFFASEAGKKQAQRTYLQVRDGVPYTDPAIPQFSQAEEAEMQDFIKSSAGRKLLVDNITQQQPVLTAVKDQVRVQLTDCKDVAKDATAVALCRSAPVQTADEKCGAYYEVTQRKGTKERKTDLLVKCKAAVGNSLSLIAQLKGKHENVGFNWRDARTLEVILPAAVRPPRNQSTDAADASLKFEYRARVPGDSPANACEAIPHGH
jgi:hypothetical protein